MTQLTRVVVWRLFMRNRPRILFQPTHLENSDPISRIELPWNPTKIFIPADSAWSTESFLIFPPGSTFLEKSWLLGIQPSNRKTINFYRKFYFDFIFMATKTSLYEPSEYRLKIRDIIHTGKWISSLGKVPLEIFPGKRHIVWVLTVILSSEQFHYGIPAPNVIRYKTSCRLKLVSIFALD